MLRLTAFLFLLASLPAQAVRIVNHGGSAWSGWKRITVDHLPPYAAGWQILPNSPADADTVQREVVLQYVVGRQVGLDTHVVDVWTRLLPGQTIALDLAPLVECAVPTPTLPADPIAYFGALLPTANGTPLQFAPGDGLRPDGAGWSAHWRGRIAGARLLVVDLWVTWYPSQPWCSGECLVTASNPLVPDLTEVAAAGVTIAWGDAQVRVLGQATPGLVVPAGTQFGDGQGRAVPFVMRWLRHFPPADWAWPFGDDEARFVAAVNSSDMDAQRAIGGVGVAQLLVDGNPRVPAGFDAVAWARGVLPDTLTRIHDWRVGTTGPNARSGDTGAQTGDQVFVGAEALLAPGAELVRYLGALKMAARPCHHREASGAPLDPLQHHGSGLLIFWDGRPHNGLWGIVDHLGKPRALNWDEAHFEVYPDLRESSGWSGPDVEHDFFNTLAAAARLTGSPCCQELLRAQAVVYMLQETTVAGWSTSQAYAARSVGWEGILAVHLWRELEDRALAERVKAHWLTRWNVVLRPALFGRDVWDARLDDPRLGVGWWFSPWQQCVGAYGLDLAGRVFAVPDARTCAMQAARAVIDHACDFENGKWRTYSAVSRDFTQRFTGQDSNIFWLFGTPMGAWLLRGEERGGAIWAQMVGDATQTFQAQWLPPGGQ